MKKKLVIITIFLLVIATIPVFATDKNAFKAGDTINSEEEVNSTSFFAGNNINLSSTIDGLSFVAGNNIIVSNKQDYLFVAGNNIEVVNADTKDAFVAGNSVTIESSKIRDLYVAAEDITITSDITRDAYIGGNKVTINGAIKGDLKIAADEIIIGENASVKGTLKYPEKANIKVAETAEVQNKETYKTKEVNTEVTLKDTIISAVTSFLSLLLVAFILLATNKKLFKQISKEEKSVNNFLKNSLIGLGLLLLIPFLAIIDFLKNSLIGLGLLLLIPFLAIIALFTVIGIPMSIIVLLLYGIFIYISLIPTAYYLGGWILKDKITNEYVLLGISLFVIFVIKYIPIIGGLVNFIFLIFGFAILLKQMKKSMHEK